MNQERQSLRASETVSGRRRVAFYALGCRVNFEEAECLSGQFAEHGYQTVPFDQQAEVYVINTCTVTGFADAESRKIVRRAVRRKPSDGAVIVTGCYAQRDPERLRALEGVDLVLGNSEKSALIEHLLRLAEDRRLAGDLWEGAAIARETPLTESFLSHGKAPAGTGRTRATLKIQDGCNEHCTYCIIPSVRGISVSREIEEVLIEAKSLAAIGYREIALTGVNTGCFGHDRGNPEGLAELVSRLDSLELPLRFRLNSLEPATVTEALLDALESASCFCEHFHVPLQHGDARILRRMSRGYDPEFYADKIARIHARFPQAGIGADVMVGFPGEDEDCFEQSRAFVASLPLSYLHVFTYSEREGTPATRMAKQLSPQVKQARSRSLHQLEVELRRAFLARQIGREVEVLVEAKPGPGAAPAGLSREYVRVELSGAGAAAKEHELWRARVEEQLDEKWLRAAALSTGPMPVKTGKHLAQ
ncbi:MAG: tRNA (N(6)-L-threonylcarbamoyladenosine(37)-C(2))-methylthiotransferase MtaB [Planctomycetota bacterium]|nr:MAG: tRNA (N(6)-L-threonylcarbamoyladenosine(37)-C(2))-methylthiotransferase MtaB [Planctomycetota bacterium]